MILPFNIYFIQDTTITNQYISAEFYFLQANVMKLVFDFNTVSLLLSDADDNDFKLVADNLIKYQEWKRVVLEEHGQNDSKRR